MRKCPLSNLNAVFEEIAKNNMLFMPVDRNDGKAEYKRWEKGDEWSEQLNTVRSPKDLFFPQTENLMEFKTNGKSIEIIDTRTAREDFVVFGVRPCDAKALEILDRVFLSEPRDSYYASAREHGIIVTVACNKPSEACFCSVLDIDASEPQGDVSAWKCENEIFFKANTEKGEMLLQKISHLTKEADESSVNDQKEKIKKIIKRLPLANVSREHLGAGKTKELFDSPVWEELSKTCLGCGTCTFVCPTCQCYDIKDFNTGNGVVRFRCWDSCMYSEFTKMAHGNNRNSQKERFRQRFMHKLVYFPENNEGIFGCVGCGRCVARCPISMNIVKVMKKLGGQENE